MTWPFLPPIHAKIAASDQWGGRNDEASDESYGSSTVIESLSMACYHAQSWIQPVDSSMA